MRISKIGRGIASACCVVGLFAAGAQAVTVVDNFDYANGALTGQGTASGGWAGAWTTNASSSLSVNAAGGYAVGGPGGSALGNKRTFATPLSITNGDPTIWFSYDLRIDFDGTTGNSQDNMGLEGAGSYGRLNAPSGNLEWSAYVLASSPYYEFSGVNIPDDEWSSVLVKLTPTGTGTADYAMWINANYALGEDDPSQVAPVLTGAMSLGNASISSVTIYSTYKDSSNISYYDNLRVSTDSSPFAVPEPATAGLVGMGMLLLVRRRR